MVVLLYHTLHAHTGKLFRANELASFVTFLLLFAEDKPCDWLLASYINDKVCRLDKDVVWFIMRNHRTCDIAAKCHYIYVYT